MDHVQLILLPNGHVQQGKVQEEHFHNSFQIPSYVSLIYLVLHRYSEVCDDRHASHI